MFKLTDELPQIGIITLDAERLQRFYVDVLGLHAGAVTEIAGGGEIRRATHAGMTIKFVQHAQPPEASAPGGTHRDATGIRYITLYVSDADNTHSELSSSLESVSPIRDTPALRVFFIKDPDGNTVELIETLKR